LYVHIFEYGNGAIMRFLRRVSVGVAGVIAALALMLTNASPAAAEDQIAGYELNQLPNSGAIINIGPAAPKPAYNGARAAQWARDHATANQPIMWPGCTWFASVSAWMGGLPMTPEWNDQGTHSRKRIQGTVTATAAPNFVEYLTSIGWATTLPITDRFRTNAVPEARLGDMIAYDWTNDGTYDHLAVVTGIAPGNYPKVSEWGTAHAPHRSIDYVDRGWTWSENSHKWIQGVYPGVSATLVRIR
jgi:surface antigen